MYISYDSYIIFHSPVFLVLSQTSSLDRKQELKKNCTVNFANILFPLHQQVCLIFCMSECVEQER